jgi:hypothetical protein
MTIVSNWNQPNELLATCRSRSGSIIQLAVLDLSATGCMVERRAWGARPEDHILIRLPGLSYMPASVLWVEEDAAGIAFDQPMYEPVLAHLQQRLGLDLRRTA